MKKIIYYIIFVMFLVAGYFAYTFEFDPSVVRGREDAREVFVYETEVDSQADCASFEEYDAEKKLCRFECETEEQCQTMEAQAQAEFDTWTEDIKNNQKDVEEKSIPSGDPSQVAVYTVTTGENIVFKDGQDTQENRKIWNNISELSPNSLTDNYVEEFQVFDNKDDDTLAFVDDEDGNGKWRIAVNLAGHKSSTLREQKSTIVHELAHIISLNTSQLSQTEDCSTLKLEEGCTKTNSYVNNFYQNFWKGLTTSEFNEEKFVTEYATTNVVEDLAESFAFYVLEKDMESLGNTMRDEKLKYFYQYPELVKIREDMRNVLTKDVIRAKKNTN